MSKSDPERKISERIHELNDRGYTGANSEEVDFLNKLQNSLLPDDELLGRYHSRKEAGEPTTKIERELEHRGINYEEENDWSDD